MKLFGYHPWCNLKWETVEYRRVGIVGSYKHRRATCTECAFSQYLHISKSYDEDWPYLREKEGQG